MLELRKMNYDEIVEQWKNTVAELVILGVQASFLGYMELDNQKTKAQLNTQLVFLV